MQQPARAAATLEGLEVHLTQDQKAFIRQAIQTGRLQREEDALREAMALWEERERRRLEMLTSIELAEKSLARAQGRRVATQKDVSALVSEVRRRGLVRLGTEQNAR